MDRASARWSRPQRATSASLRWPDVRLTSARPARSGSVARRMDSLAVRRSIGRAPSARHCLSCIRRQSRQDLMRARMSLAFHERVADAMRPHNARALGEHVGHTDVLRRCGRWRLEARPHPDDQRLSLLHLRARWRVSQASNPLRETPEPRVTTRRPDPQMLRANRELQIESPRRPSRHRAPD